MKNEIVIKRTKGDDIDFRNMVKALDEGLYLRNGDSQAQYEQYNQIDKIRNAIVIYYMGEAVGCGCFKPFDSETIEIKRMFVSPNLRGLGFAFKILQALESWAIEEGNKNAVLETGVRQLEAQSLYKKAGYSLTENYGQYIGMKDSICYRKRL